MRRFVRYAVTFLIGLLIILAVYLLKSPFAEYIDYDGHLMSVRAQQVRALCDGSFLASVLMLGIGALIFVANEGLFCIFSYGGKLLLSLLRFRKTEEVSESYLAYYNRMRESRTAYLFLLLTGAVFLGIAIIFYFLYERYY